MFTSQTGNKGTILTLESVAQSQRSADLWSTARLFWDAPGPPAERWECPESMLYKSPGGKNTCLGSTHILLLSLKSSEPKKRHNSLSLRSPLINTFPPRRIDAAVGLTGSSFTWKISQPGYNLKSVSCKPDFQERIMSSLMKLKFGQKVWQNWIIRTFTNEKVFKTAALKVASSVQQGGCEWSGPSRGGGANLRSDVLLKWKSELQGKNLVCLLR